MIREDSRRRKKSSNFRAPSGQAPSRGSSRSTTSEEDTSGEGGRLGRDEGQEG